MFRTSLWLTMTFVSELQWALVVFSVVLNLLVFQLQYFRKQPVIWINTLFLVLRLLGFSN